MNKEWNLPIRIKVCSITPTQITYQTSIGIGWGDSNLWPEPTLRLRDVFMSTMKLVDEDIIPL